MPSLVRTIPWPDKLRLGAAMASEESRNKFFTFQAAVLESAYQVKRAYYQLYFLTEKARVNDEALKLLDFSEKLARAQNEVGKATLQDVLRVQTDQARLEIERVNLDHSRPALLMQFKAA